MSIHSMRDFATTVEEALGTNLDSRIDAIARDLNLDLAEAEKAAAAADYLDAITQSHWYPDGITAPAIATACKAVNLNDIVVSYY